MSSNKSQFANNLIKVNEIIDRAKESHKIKRDVDFADLLNIKQSTLSSWRSRNTFDLEILLSKMAGVNLDWLLLGKGDRFIDYEDTIYNSNGSVVKEDAKGYDVSPKENSLKRINEQLTAQIQILKELILELKKEST